MSILRDITLAVKKYLYTPEILLFIGARQAGKTTILKQLQEILLKENQQCFFLNLEDPDYLKLLNDSPKNLFKIFPFNRTGKTYIFIDEIQYLENPSNFLKYFYDEYKDNIKLIVSGSSAFYLDRKFKDSLAGRKKIFHVRTLSFREFLRFKGEEKLSVGNFENVTLSDKEKIQIYYREFIIYGGYPRVVLADLQDKKDVLQEIAYSYIKKDIFDAHIRQDDVFYKLFKILASGIGQLVNTSELAGTLGVSRTIINNYLAIMRKSFHVFLIKPFARNMRKELTKMPKVYFYDLGLRNFFTNNFSQYDLREDSGVLLENSAFRQLIERYDEEEIRFWRTVSQQEVDFIVNEKTAYEVKVNLKQFKRQKYAAFLEQYPSISLNIITFGADDPAIGRHRVLEVWQI